MHPVLTAYPIARHAAIVINNDGGTMDQQTAQTQATGDFYAPLNRYKTPGDTKPMFTGQLQSPGDEAKLPFALWPFEYTDKKSGEVKRGYSGLITGVATNVPAQDQIEAMMAKSDAAEITIDNLTLRPGQIVLFENGFKAEEPTKNRPDLWGWVVPTNGKPAFRSSVWVKHYEDSGKAYLSGATQYPRPGRSERDEMDAAAKIQSEAAAPQPQQRKEASSRAARAGRGR
jgi:hypothetical protein